MTRLALLPLRSALLAAGVLVLAAGLALAPRPAGAAGPHSRTTFEKSVINQLVSQVNGYRKQHRLPALRIDPRLSNSARAHSWRMALADDMEHQVPGEAGVGARIDKAGYHWTSCGENIGYTTRRSASGARQIIALMYAERSPNDPHRRNMLDRGFADVGMDVYNDPTHGTLWLTTDFGHR